jgi:hypothetical protein
MTSIPASTKSHAASTLAMWQPGPRNSVSVTKQISGSYARQHGTRAWRYLLIPHDAVAVNATLPNLAATYWVSAA